MNKNAGRAAALALALCLLFAACGGQGALPPNAAPEEEMPPMQSGFPELEETDWQAVSIDAKDYGIAEEPIGDPAIYGGAASLSLDKLIAFSLSSDGAAAEDLDDELRRRFLEAPNTMLAYLVLIGGQRNDNWNDRPAADVICESIACADAAWHGGSEEFAAAIASCRERYPTGRIAELLDVMEREHAASMERNHVQSQ